MIKDLQPHEIVIIFSGIGWMISKIYEVITRQTSKALSNTVENTVAVQELNIRVKMMTEQIEKLNHSLRRIDKFEIDLRVAHKKIKNIESSL